jgi:hypothetical protein
MATQEPQAPKDLGEKLQSVPKSVLYLLLVLACAVPLFFNIELPNKPVDPSIDLYAAIGSLPEGSTVLLSSDWTNSTRGENAGEMDVVLRLLMRRHVKFAVFSTADPNAPEVAKNEIAAINEERKLDHEAPYVRWKDWVDVGFFPNGEGTANALAASVRDAFSGKKDVNENSESVDIFQSPVLKKVSKISDLSMFIEITGSNTSKVYIQRLSGKVKLAFLVTGVMGPETFNYYSSGQLIGLASGIKGVYDMETLLNTGVNVPDAQGKTVHAPKVQDEAPGYPGKINKGKGTIYYPSLHAAMFLLIFAVIAGNVGMLLSKRKAR